VVRGRGGRGRGVWSRTGFGEGMCEKVVVGEWYILCSICISCSI